MTGLLENIHLALPEMIILIMACSGLVTDLFIGKRYPSLAFIWVSLALIAAGIVSFAYLGQYNTVIFQGLFICDDIGNLLKLFIYISVFLSFFYSRLYLAERQMPSGDYYYLGLFSTLGMMSLVSAHSLLTLYLGLELLSLPLYAMTAIRRTVGDSTEAAMKYFVMGSIASGMLLYGISLVYGATGSLDLYEVANAITAQWGKQSTLLSFAFVFILSGIGFKMALVPFHMWAPDVYQGAPTSVTLFISAAPKLAAVGMMLRIVTLALGEFTVHWQALLLIMALLSIGIGNLLAISQNNIKRLFAYSAISHMGYTLLGIAAATSAGYAAALYYVLIYSLMSVGALGLIVLMSRSGLEIDQVSDFQGLNKRNPWLAFMMMIILFSMAGVPPAVGFFVKLLVLKALVDVHLVWAAVLGLIFAVFGAVYYLRIIKVMYFDDAVDLTPVSLSPASNLVFSLNCLLLLYLGILPNALTSACVNALAVG